MRLARVPGPTPRSEKGSAPHAHFSSPPSRIQVHHSQMRQVDEALNHELVYIGLPLTDTASATHALSCRVPDRDSNETKYLGEARDDRRVAGPVALDAHLKVMMAAKPRK